MSRVSIEEMEMLEMLKNALRPIVVDYNKKGENLQEKIAFIGYSVEGKMMSVQTMINFVEEKRGSDERYNEFYFYDKDIETDKGEIITVATLQLGNEPVRMHDVIDYTLIGEPGLARFLTTVKSLDQLIVPNRLLKPMSELRGEFIPLPEPEDGNWFNY